MIMIIRTVTIMIKDSNYYLKAAKMTFGCP